MNGPVGRKTLCAATIMAALFSAACVPPPDVAPLAAAIDAQPGRVPPLLADTPFGREVTLSVAASPRVARGQASLLEAEAALMAERAAAFPDLSLSLALPTGGAVFVPALTVTQLVFDAGARAARERAAEAGVLGQRADRMDAIAQAALEAVEAWAGVATARETVEAAEATLAAIEQVTAQIEARGAAGAGSSVDVLTARSRLESERAAVAAARAELVRAQTIFAELFGRAPDEGLGLPPALPALPALVADSSPTLLAAEAARLSAAAEL